MYMEYTWYIPTIYLIGVPDVRDSETWTQLSQAVIKRDTISRFRVTGTGTGTVTQYHIVADCTPSPVPEYKLDTTTGQHLLLPVARDPEARLGYSASSVVDRYLPAARVTVLATSQTVTYDYSGFGSRSESSNRSWAYTGEKFISPLASKLCPLRMSTTTCKGADHGLTAKLDVYTKIYISRFQKKKQVEKNPLNIFYRKKR